MKIELKIKHWIGMGIGSLIILLDFIFFFNFTGEIGAKVWYFSPIIVMGLFLGGIFFIVDILNEGKRQKELEVKFLEFVRSLVENVRAGVTIPQAILHVSNSNFGALTQYIKKLANQIEWGYPLHDALTIFAKDTRNEVIKRSIAIVIEAEKSGGNMSAVLEAVTQSVLEVKQIKDERKSNAYEQIIQSYIIFFMFVVIMIVMQVYLIPKISVISADIGTGIGSSGLAGLGSGSKSQVDFGPIFTATIIIQGLFAGLLLGKFAEGDYKAGLKHALAMIMSGYLITSTASGLIKPAESAAVALILLIPKYLILKWKKGD